MSWQLALMALFGALVIFCAIYLIVEEIQERRRDTRDFRISPLYRVGDDAKEPWL